MKIVVNETKQEMGHVAAVQAADILRKALSEQETITIVVATGMSQFEMLAELVMQPGIEWNRVEIFHLDEYIGMPDTHPASFRKYLRERLLERLPVPPLVFHGINAETDAEGEVRRMNALLSTRDVVVAFVGIGENGHLAFNDPPADFDTTDPYIFVDLDEDCRRQQFGEGWFPTLEDVPKRAISMSIQQVLTAREIICCVPDSRKAKAVQRTIEGSVTNLAPASIMQRHPATTVYLDKASAALLTR